MSSRTTPHGVPGRVELAFPLGADIPLTTSEFPAASRAAAADALALYRAVFVNATQPIAIVDARGEYLEQNAAHAALFGYEGAELAGRTPAIHLGEAVFAEIAAELAATGHCEREVTSRAKDGRELVVELSAFAVRDRGGEPVCYIGIKRDVTEHRRATAERERRITQLQAVHRLTSAVGRARALGEIYDEALDALRDALGADRASILLFDDDGVMRFKAWRGLSETYRRVVEGHTPWTRDARDPRPIVVPDADAEPSLAAYRATVRAEGIRALAFIPLVSEGRLIGKFMLYFPQPRTLPPEELRLAESLASHVAFAIERTRAESALRRSEERFRSLSVCSPVGIFMTDLWGRCTYSNPRCQAICGFTEAQALDEGWIGFVHPEDRGRTYEAWTAHARAGRDFSRQVRFVNPALGVRWTSINTGPLRRDDGMVIGHVGTIEDITDHKRAADAYRFLAEAGEVLASSLDFGTTIDAIARLAVPTLGDWCFVDTAEIDGTLHRIAVAHADPARAPLAARLRRDYPPRRDRTHGVQRAIDTGQPEILDDLSPAMLRSLATDADHLELLQAIEPCAAMWFPLVSRGRTIGAMTFLTAESGRRYDRGDLALATELTRRAALAVENARLYREAQQANLAKSRFLATMSHELRTPLNAIAGYTELLTLGVHGPLDERQVEDLRRIQLNQRHLLALIEDLLDLTKLESGHLELHLADVSPNDALAAAYAVLEPQMRARRIECTYEPGVPGVTCRADPERTRQVLVNLLSNAIKFTEPGGRVELRWDATQDTIDIRVRDTGPGIPADKLEVIFEPFVQLNMGLASRSEGTGLGLAISRDLARAMGGELSVSSRVGEGSEFVLRLPRR